MALERREAWLSPGFGVGMVRDRDRYYKIFVDEAPARSSLEEFERFCRRISGDRVVVEADQSPYDKVRKQLKDAWLDRQSELLTQITEDWGEHGERASENNLLAELRRKIASARGQTHTAIDIGISTPRADVTEANFRSIIETRTPAQFVSWITGLGDSQTRPSDAILESVEKVFQRTIDDYEALKDSRALINCLEFCSQIPQPSRFFKHLMSLYERVREGGSNDVVRSLLRDSLVVNQSDPRIQSVWVEMLRGKEMGLLGTKEDGAFGLIFMPNKSGTRPSAEAVGTGLTELASCLETQADRRIAFHAAIDQVRARFPGWNEVDEELIRLADEHQWPTWALEATPTSLVVQARAEPSCVYLWNPVAEVVRSAKRVRITTQRQICEGMVDVATIDPREFRLVVELGNTLEVTRRFPGQAREREWLAEISYRVQLAESEAERVGESASAQRMRLYRSGLLSQAQIGFSRVSKR